MTSVEDEQAAREFAQLVLQNPNLPNPIFHRQGIINKVGVGADKGTVEIYLSGDTDVPLGGIRYSRGYQPVVGETCWVVKNGPDLWVLGSLETLSTPVGDWQNLTPINGWTAFGAPYETGRYWKDPEGWVYVQGVFKGGTLGQSMAQLPSQYRPWRVHHFPGLVGPTATGARIDIDTGGNIIAVRTDTGGTNVFCAFSCRFMDSFAYVTASPPRRTEWLPAAPAGGWQPYAATEGPPMIHVREDGFCQTSGILQGGTVAADSLLLPDNARTGWQQLFQTPGFNGTVYAIGRIDVSRAYLKVQAGGTIEAPLDGLHWWNWKTEAATSPYAWVNYTTQNGWTNYDNNYTFPAAKNDKYGVVHVRGLVKNGTATSGTQVMALGSNQRPSMRMVYPAGTSAGSGRVDVLTDGTIVIMAGANGFLGLEQIMFRTEV
jgi:hypothetical protein